MRMINIDSFWKDLRMSGFCRLTESNSTWAKLHIAEGNHNAFNLISSKYESINKSKTSSKNIFWKDLYISLLTFRDNDLNCTWKSSLPRQLIVSRWQQKNNKAIRQNWCQNEMIGSKN